MASGQFNSSENSLITNKKDKVPIGQFIVKLETAYKMCRLLEERKERGKQFINGIVQFL